MVVSVFPGLRRLQPRSQGFPFEIGRGQGKSPWNEVEVFVVMLMGHGLQVVC